MIATTITFMVPFNAQSIWIFLDLRISHPPDLKTLDQVELTTHYT